MGSRGFEERARLAATVEGARRGGYQGCLDAETGSEAANSGEDSGLEPHCLGLYLFLTLVLGNLLILSALVSSSLKWAP